MSLSTKSDIERVFGVRYSALIEEATRNLPFDSPEYWGAVEPLAAEWLAAKTPSECIRLTAEFRGWIRAVRSLKGLGSVIVDPITFNLNKGRIIPHPYAKGQRQFGYIPLALDEDRFAQRSLDIGGDYTDAVLDIIQGCSEDEVLLSVVLELPNGYIAINNEVISL